MVDSVLWLDVWFLHILARQYSILLPRHKKLNILRYFSMASAVKT